ncbi:CRISPR-associated endonuclease Cas2 [Microscilla marina]|uniref:CRISPR-associated endoribonuclease Cas2 n=1 Tax=Microscilla marina ATCC 23134 TaxID=313606 RepID=A1ZHZ6_MICM2|nr:CRISPR-associated endonuclease Cas2 [Microscilla marina]EAY30153.1 crispr-associated protein Cas2 [Microscilla marina ATCC 23134]
MIVWVLYDIENDRARTKVSKFCQQAGLSRVQYSVFLGTIDAHRRDTLALQVEEVIDADKDKVYILPMSKDEVREAVCLGQALDEKLVTDQVQSLFF